MNLENRVFLLCLITLFGYHEHEKLGISALFHASLTAITLAGDPSPVHAEADVCSDFG